MRYYQLHYTSCEKGLSGQSGFQYCALTSGVPREVTREIERLTVYEPPRRLAPRDAAGSDSYPVNLLYAFSQQRNAVIIARIVYLGVDFSNRSGNYFVHALVREADGSGDGPLFPVEFWEAPFWVSGQGNKPELPMLSDPLPRGPIGPEDVGGLPYQPHEAAFAVLLTAIGEAMAGGHQVLLIDADTTAVCRRIAAACYLLGPDLACGLTFSTYSHDPRRCPTHVIGTVESAGPFRADVVAHTVPFNFAEGAVPDLAPCSSALLIVRIGVRGSAAIWKLAASLAPPVGVSFAGYFEVLASAALLLDHKLTDAEINAAVTWLAYESGEKAVRHYPAAVQAVLRHRLERLPARCQTALIELALQAETVSAGHRQALASKVECALVDTAFDELDQGEQAGEIVTLRTADGRSKASDSCSSRLESADAGSVIRLLAWASAAGAEPADDAVLRAGREAIGGAVLDGQIPPGLLSVAQSWPALRRGLLTRLALTDVSRQQALLSGQLAALFQSEDFASYPELHENWLVAAVRRGHVRPVEACQRIVALRYQLGQSPAIGGALLAKLWAGRDWEIAEATEMLTTLPPDELANSVARSHCVRILQGAASAFYSDEWMTFVVGLSKARQVVELDERLLAVYDLAPVIRLLRQATAERMALEPALLRLAQLYTHDRPEVCDLLDWHVPPLVLRHPRPGSILTHCPEPLFGQYCGYVFEMLTREPHDISLAAWTYLTMKELGNLRDIRYRDMLHEHVLGPILPKWPRHEINAVVDEIERLKSKEGDIFRLWLGEYKRPWLFPRRKQPTGM